MAMITVKGGNWHRLWGKIYFWAMVVVALTAAVMCWLRSGLFLFLIAIFSFYLALTGYRVLQRKKPVDKARPADVLAAIAMGVAGGGLIVLGVLETNGERWVRIAFGSIGLFLAVMDIAGFFRPSRQPKGWLLFHMTRFLAAYIATVTAFSVVNFQFLPYLWRWLWPTVIGTFGIGIWRRYYERKFGTQTHGIIQ